MIEVWLDPYWREMESDKKRMSVVVRPGKCSEWKVCSLENGHPCVFLRSIVSTKVTLIGCMCTYDERSSLKDFLLTNQKVHLQDVHLVAHRLSMIPLTDMWLLRTGRPCRFDKLRLMAAVMNAEEVVIGYAISRPAKVMNVRSINERIQKFGHHDWHPEVPQARAKRVRHEIEDEDGRSEGLTVCPSVSLTSLPPHPYDDIIEELNTDVATIHLMTPF
jgi:hypothetical protein